MNKDELYQILIKMIPIKTDSVIEFRGVVKNILDDYCKYLRQFNDFDNSDKWKATLNRVTRLCRGINRAIEKEYMGMRHSAYSIIKNQLEGYNSNTGPVDGLAYNYNVFIIEKDSIAYRMRNIELKEQYRLKAGDMFHIPLDKRGLVKTQRFSVPGYPCLYLSKTIYGCWEEMRRPVFGTVMVSKFCVQSRFSVLDLRVPSKDKWNNHFEQCVVFFPLVLSSMVQVNNIDDTYKPEYLIPQLLTEWIISHNQKLKTKNQLYGIMYTSVHKNKDFDYPEDSCDNFAIPVIEPLSEGTYCKSLSHVFKLTPPTYYDLEVLRQGSLIDGGYFGLTEEQQKEYNLRQSPFGRMAEYLNNKPLESLCNTII